MMTLYEGIYEIHPPDWANNTWLVVDLITRQVLASCTSEEAARASVRLFSL